jgi:hypothetical protein
MDEGKTTQNPYSPMLESNVQKSFFVLQTVYINSNKYMASGRIPFLTGKLLLIIARHQFLFGSQISSSPQIPPFQLSWWDLAQALHRSEVSSRKELRCKDLDCSLGKLSSTLDAEIEKKYIGPVTLTSC